jgi:hypothetical protein
MYKAKPLFIFLLLVALTGFKSDDLPAKFTNRLERAGMTFTPPIGFVNVPIVKNGRMHYEYAIKAMDRNFEIRYSIQPLDSVFIQYDSLKKSGTIMTVTPNNLYYGSFIASMGNIGMGGRTPQINPFPLDAVKSEFNADWGASGVCEPSGDFGKGYKYCMGVTIHKDNLADAYIFYLTNDLNDLQAQLIPIFYALKFK